MARPTAAQRLARERDEQARRTKEQQPARPEAKTKTKPATTAPAPAESVVATGWPDAPQSTRSASDRDERLYDPLLTIDQVADWLGIPKGTLYQWRSKHRGPRSIKVGNIVRYRRSAVEEYLDTNTEQQHA